MPGADTPEQAVFRIIYERRRAARVAEVPLGHDILRHTFATYYVALTGHPAMASKVLGHYKLHTLAAHYDGVATKAEAKDYFSARVTEVLT
jgi:integrase